MANYNRSLVPAALMLKMGAWRAPIFMVDRIIDFTPGEKGYITVIKHVTFNEPYIPGHFPDNPVMPGVMIAEIFGQSSEYFSLVDDYCRRHEKDTGEKLKRFDDIARSLTKPEGATRIIEERNRVTGFLASQDVKFRHIVYPGDTVEVTSRLANHDINGFHHYDVEARVGRHIACSGRIINFRAEHNQAENKRLLTNYN